MALDFTKIKDEPGAAVFLLHDGTELGEREFTQLAEDVRRRCKKQIIILSADETVGHSIIDFYNLRGSKFVLIVRDDDQLHHALTDGDRFDAAQIAYIADQAG